MDDQTYSGFDKELTEEEAAALILGCEEVIEAIKNGEIEGEYFEF